MAVELAPDGLKGGEALGEVVGVYNFGAGDMIDVKLADGRTELVPFSDAAIAKVDTELGKIIVNPLPGLFENDSDAEERAKEEE